MYTCICTILLRFTGILFISRCFLNQRGNLWVCAFATGWLMANQTGRSAAIGQPIANWLRCRNLMTIWSTLSLICLIVSSTSMRLPHWFKTLKHFESGVSSSGRHCPILQHRKIFWLNFAPNWYWWLKHLHEELDLYQILKVTFLSCRK